MSRLTRDRTAEPVSRLPNPSRETKFSGANGDREIFVFPFPVQLITSRIGNLTRLILTLAICDDDDHTYIHTYIYTVWSAVSISKSGVQTTEKTVLSDELSMYQSHQK